MRFKHLHEPPLKMRKEPEGHTSTAATKPAKSPNAAAMIEKRMSSKVRDAEKTVGDAEKTVRDRQEAQENENLFKSICRSSGT